LRYIPDDVALTRADIVAQLLAHAPSAACGAIADGTIEQAALDKILNELGRRKPALLETWCTSQEKPLLAALDPTHLQAFPVSQADATAAFNQLFEGLSPENQARYRRVTESYEHSSADDHCWFARTLFDGVNRVREPSRSKLARIALGQDVEK
jgi:hypothetical protein